MSDQISSRHGRPGADENTAAWQGPPRTLHRGPLVPSSSGDRPGSRSSFPVTIIQLVRRCASPAGIRASALDGHDDYPPVIK